MLRLLRIAAAATFLCFAFAATADASTVAPTHHQATFTQGHAAHLPTSATHHHAGAAGIVSASVCGLAAVCFILVAFAPGALAASKKRYRRYPTGLSPPSSPAL